MTLRAIDISDQDAVARPDPGPLPDMRWLSLSELQIDDRYQRPLGKANWRTIRKIAGAFDWSLFAPVVAAPLTDGGFAVIDGQHRAHAAALAGQDRIPALVVDVPPESQARAFAGINTQRTGLTMFHLFKAGRASGEPWALACDQAVSSAGCRLMPHNTTFRARKPREIYAIAMVRDHVAGGRARLVTRALSAIAASPGAERPELYQANILKPWIAGVHASGVDSFAVLSDFLAAHDLIKLCTGLDHLRARPGNERLSAFKLATMAVQAALVDGAAKGASAPIRAAPVHVPAAKPRTGPVESLEPHWPRSMPAKMSSAPQEAKPSRPAPSAGGDGVRWPAEWDRLLRESAGRPVVLQRLADRWDLPLTALQARYFKVRASA